MVFEVTFGHILEFVEIVDNIDGLSSLKGFAFVRLHFLLLTLLFKIIIVILLFSNRIFEIISVISLVDTKGTSWSYFFVSFIFESGLAVTKLITRHWSIAITLTSLSLVETKISALVDNICLLVYHDIE